MMSSGVNLIGPSLNQRAGGTFKIRDILAARADQKSGTMNNGADFERLSASGGCKATGMTCIDNVSNITITLPDSTIGKMKEFSLLHANEYIVTIVTNSGSFRMGRHAMHRRLIFTERGYTILHHNNYFFPSRQSQKLVGKRCESSNAGGSICMSSDGHTLAVGGPGYQSGKGVVWIFVYDQKISRWVEEERIESIDSIGDITNFGFSVALSGDGNILVVGGPIDNYLDGSIWVYKRVYREPQDQKIPIYKNREEIISALRKRAYTCETTYQEAKINFVSRKVCWDFVTKLNCSDPGANFGTTLNLWNDRLLIGGQGDDGGVGAVWKYNLESLESQKIIPGDHIGCSEIGSAVKACGDRIFFSGIYDDKNHGAVWVYDMGTSTRDSQYLQKIVPPKDGCYLFGSSIDVSADNNRLVIGSAGDNDYHGSVYIYENETVYVEKDGKIVGDTKYRFKTSLEVSNVVGSAKIGTSVAISSDGNVITVGGCDDDNYRGAVWVFIYEDENWVQTNKLRSGVTRRGDSGKIGEGTSVTLSAHGNILAVGCVGDDGGGSIVIWK